MNSQRICRQIVTEVVVIHCVAACCAAAEAPSAALTNRTLTIRNAHTTIVLDRQTGHIVRMHPGSLTPKGPWFAVHEEDRSGLLPTMTWKRGAVSVFHGGAAHVSAASSHEEAKGTLRWDRPNGLVITAELALRANEKGARVRLTVQNITGASLVDTIEAPMLRGVSHGDAADDWFTWPHTLGARFRVQGMTPGKPLESPYPAFMYMQWIDLYDESHGLYIGCEDAYGYSKSLRIGRDADGLSVFGFVFTGCWVARKGDSWTTPWVRIMPHTGDWRVGADTYRQFAQTAFGPLCAPEYMRDMPTAQCWLAHHGSDADLGRLFEIQQQAPIHGSYVMKSLNTSIPEGWDGMRGSALEYHDAFQRVTELGGARALFTFDRAPLMGRPNYAAYAQRWLSKRRDGSFEEGFRDMMPSPFDADFVRARVGEAVRWVREFNLDAIHYDTEGTCGDTGAQGTGMFAGPNYHPDHPQRPNETPHYFKRLLRVTVDACRKINPAFTLRAEHGADFFFPEFATSTAHFGQSGTAALVASYQPPADAAVMPLLFRYTLPQHAAMQMPGITESRYWMYGYGMGHGFHGGGPSWCFNPDVRDDESPGGELIHRYRFYDDDWRRYYDFRVGFREAVVDGFRSDITARYREGDRWILCSAESAITAVTHTGRLREVTLGATTEGVGRKGPVRLRIPTTLSKPIIRLHGRQGEAPVTPVISNGWIEVTVPDPSLFAVEVSEGPQIRLESTTLAYPGEPAKLMLRVDQSNPQEHTLRVQVPANWPGVPPITIPAIRQHQQVIVLRPPAGIFGRNYPVKVTLERGSFRRTAATHVKVMDRLTVLYQFRLDDAMSKAAGYVDPDVQASLNVTLINNSPSPVQAHVRLQRRGSVQLASAALGPQTTDDLGHTDSPVHRWLETQSEIPGCAREFHFPLSACGTAANPPLTLTVQVDGKTVYRKRITPRLRVMDLSGPWKLQTTRLSQATVGGAERLDNLDTEQVTPDVWDGGWMDYLTGTVLDEPLRKSSSWGVYRRLVHIPADWQGADIWMRLPGMGGPWGAGGTLNLVYINGWPAGRLGYHGECRVSPLLVFGGFNLIAIASWLPNRMDAPMLFVRSVPEGIEMKPDPQTHPSGAFLLLSQRATGQGITQPFIKGVPEDNHVRTDTARGGEHSFIYFAVADDYLHAVTGPVAITIEYLDRGHGEIELDYDSHDATAPVSGAFKSANPHTRTDTGTWKRHTFLLQDARFTNRQHQGADFRVSGRNGDLHLRSVSVQPVVADPQQPQ